MFKFPDWCYHQLPKSRLLWIILWVIWFTTLWHLSSRSPKPEDPGLDIPHLDKVMHFGYFMLGGFFISNFAYLTKHPLWSWKNIIILTIIIGATVGVIDEHHQTYTPGRTGHSIGDWIADASGSTAGALYCFFMWRRIKKRHAI